MSNRKPQVGRAVGGERELVDREWKTERKQERGD